MFDWFRNVYYIVNIVKKKVFPVKTIIFGFDHVGTNQQI